MTEMYFAAWETGLVSGIERMAELWPWEEKPMKILTSFAYASAWELRKDLFRPDKVMLDSGAFTAWQLGKPVDIEALIEEAGKDEYDECIALDKIGDWKGSRDNADYMRSKVGMDKSIPVFHIGDPWWLLDYYCRHWRRVGISCRFGEPTDVSFKWIADCFARQWPHCFHSFGYVARDVLVSFPFDSADASTWKRGTVSWGRLMAPAQGFDCAGGLKDFKARLSTMGAHVGSLWAAQEYHKMEQYLRRRWGKDLKKARAKRVAASNQISGRVTHHGNQGGGSGHGSVGGA